MSMDIPKHPVDVSQREFVLETVNHYPNPDEMQSGLSNLVLPSLNSSGYADSDRLEESRERMEKVAGEGFKIAFALGSFGGLVHGPLAGVGAAVAVLLMSAAMITLGEGVFSTVQDYLDPSSKEALMPSNFARLREDVFNAALRSGIMPNKFEDPISHDIIETPVAFSDDSTATIYDLETIKALRESEITRNPMGGDLPLDFKKLVYLPGVKKQIDEIKKSEAGEI